MDTEYVVVPSSVREICENAFGGCGELKRVFFLDNSQLNSLRSGCFKNSGITEISLPGSLQRVGAGAFLYCRSLKSVTFSEGLTTIEELAFARSAVESIWLPSTLRNIQNAFDDCTTIKNVFLPTGRMEVCYDASRRGYSGTLFVPASVESIQKHPAYACFGLQQLVFEEGSRLNEIGDYAFSNTRLESFVAPQSLRKIGTMAFQNCERLESVLLNQGLQEFGCFCFWGTRVAWPEPRGGPLQQLEFGIDEQGVRELVLPEGLKVVGPEWFAESNIETLVLSRTVRELGRAAFQCCNRLWRVSFPNDSELVVIGDNCFQGTKL